MFYILAMVALGAWLSRTRTTDWDETLYVAVYPYNADASAASTRYMGGLEEDDFRAVEAFFTREAARYGIDLDQPVRIELAGAIDEGPPQPPADRNIPGVMWWSLRLRLWAGGLEDVGPAPDIRMVMAYHDPATHPVLPHSVGLQKGLVGIVNAYASRSQAGANRVVLAHELMHTLGATDKYDPATSLPTFPDGYADPGRDPRFPQPTAELMGGRIPLSPTEARMPASLRETAVGSTTAREIRWEAAP